MLFQVTGFSIGGRVVDSNLKGVEGVKIVVDGNLRSVTDNEGYYKLDQVYNIFKLYFNVHTSARM